MAKLISQTYGLALYELARDEGKIPDIFEEVKALKQAFSDGDELMRFIKNPQITQEEKQKVIESSLKGKVSDEMLGFLVILIQKDRFAFVSEIFDYYIDRVNEENGIGKAKVSSPMELSAAQKSLVEKKLLDTTGYKEVDVEYPIDPELRGGIVIRVGDRVVDGSIRTRLYELRRSLS